jgi:hypothetical protein
MVEPETACQLSDAAVRARVQASWNRAASREKSSSKRIAVSSSF